LTSPVLRRCSASEERNVSAEVLAFAQAVHDLDVDTVAHLLAGRPHLANERPHLPARYYGGEGVRSFLFRAGPAYGRDETDAHLRMAQFLIDHGADIEVGRPDSNETPLKNNA
jgi:predicted DNA-binding transcriptional regulator YafY